MAEILNRIQLSARFKKDFRKAARHSEYSDPDLEQLLDDPIHQERLPAHYREHTLTKRASRLHRIGGHAELFASRKQRRHR